MTYTSQQIKKFWSNVAIGSQDECWEWKLSTDKYGFGKVKIGATSRNAHRVAYEICYGEPSRYAPVLHRCPSKTCCNPKHLYVQVEAPIMFTLDPWDIVTRFKLLLRGAHPSTPQDSPTPTTTPPE